jgi:hypothetical protein
MSPIQRGSRTFCANRERHVQEHGNSDVYVSLMDYRASSIDGVRLSPAQLLKNRKLKTKLPVSSELLKPEVVKSKQKELVERKFENHYQNEFLVFETHFHQFSEYVYVSAIQFIIFRSQYKRMFSMISFYYSWFPIT